MAIDIAFTLWSSILARLDLLLIFNNLLPGKQGSYP